MKLKSLGSHCSPKFPGSILQRQLIVSTTEDILYILKHYMCPSTQKHSELYAQFCTFA